MVLKINFTEPLVVSKGKLFDQAFIRVKNPKLFVSQETLKAMPADKGTIDYFPR